MAAPKAYYDFIGPMDAGINDGIEPLLLPKNQLADGINTSVRGAYLTHRPPYQKKIFAWPDPATQVIVEHGLFQGAGYYRPDFGTEQLVAQISGHLYSFTETGAVFVVQEISVPGDLNDSLAPQAWMWQAEKWLIVNNGVQLPIFYDGTTSRRSQGESTLMGVVTSTSVPTPPAQGSALVVTLTAPYTGPFNVQVLFNGAYYQTLASTASATVQLTNISATPGGTIAIGSQVIIPSGVVSLLANPATSVFVPASPGGFLQITVNLTQSVNLTAGYFLFFGGRGWVIHIVNSPTSFVLRGSGGPGDTATYPAGTPVYTSQTNPPNIVVGNTINASATIPAIGASVNVDLDAIYTGASGQIVLVNGDYYTLSTTGAPPGGNSLVLLNVTDVSVAAYTFPKNILSIPELPIGRMGCYGMGRIAFSHIDGISYDYGDVVGGASGTLAYSFRDGVLKMTESVFQSGGGSFRLPGTGDIIRGMVFGANLDAALGQGPLQVGTAENVFTCQVGFDRSQWATTTNPILTEALIGKGPISQGTDINVNSDTFFRSFDGLSSLILARRDFGSWGNVPISQEVKQILDADNQSLLIYGSAVTFDNRYLLTDAPISSTYGIYHQGLIAMSFDTVSNLRTKLPPVYDGNWNGINVLQLITGFVNGTKRCFSFSLNTDTNTIELYELLPQQTTQTMDNGTTRIDWQFDTPILFNKDIKPINELVRLADGEIYTKDISGSVDIEVQYRPDFNPTWTSWRKFTVDATNWRPRIGLGDPENVCETGGERMTRVGYFFQFRVIITGTVKWMGMRVMTTTEQEAPFARPICS